MSLRDTFRRDQVFAPLRPGTRPVRPVSYTHLTLPTKA